MSAASGQAAPPSHHGICGTCHEPIIWCMAGYWVHEREDLYRDHAPTGCNITPSDSGSTLHEYDGEAGA